MAANGCVSFHREKYVQQGGPDGGDGGARWRHSVHGVRAHAHSVGLQYKRSYAAPNGEPGKNRRSSGRSGANLVIEVPPGTLVRDKETGRILLDLYTPGEKKTLLRGGNGGFGNMHFATPTRQAPNFAKPGVKCQPLEVMLELKSIADVGLVGFPNVGKSTLLSVVTAARPKIANYHFTTLTPNLGIASQDGESFVMADIPGLGRRREPGRGAGPRLPAPRRAHADAAACHRRVGQRRSRSGGRLRRHNARTGAVRRLASGPMIVAANKTDLPGAEEHIERLRAHVADRGIEVYPISAATGEGVKPLMRSVLAMLRTLPEPAPIEPDELPLPTEERPFTVICDGGIYEVVGPSMQHLIDSVNFSDEESLNWFPSHAEALGRHRRVARAGRGARATRCAWAIWSLTLLNNLRGGGDIL